jgi:hypothetical protein
MVEGLGSGVLEFKYSGFVLRVFSTICVLPFVLYGFGFRVSVLFAVNLGED